MRKALLRKALLMSIILLALPFAVSGQWLFQEFDSAPADTNFWAWFQPVQAGNPTSTVGGHYQTSTNADSALGWIKTSYVDNPVYSGAGALRIEYSVHNIEGWGGYTKLEHWNPDSNAVYDWSAYDSVRVWYYVETPCSLPGRVEFRFNLHDVSHADSGAKTYDVTQCEYYYSFHDILDMQPGWNKIELALVNDPNAWAGQAFNLTGWAGITGNAVLDKDKIKGFSFEFSISGGGEGDHATGTILLDHMELFSLQRVELVFFTGMDVPSNVNLWQGWGGGSYEITSEEAFTPGTNSIKWNTPPNDWAVFDGLVFTLDSPKNMAASWTTDSVKFKIKADAGLGDLSLVFSDPDDDGDGPDLEFEAQYTLPEADVGYDGTWKQVAVALKDFNRFNGGWDASTNSMQPGEMDSTRVLKFKILVATANGIGKVVYLDEIWTGNPEIDVLPPAAPTGLDVVKAEYYNLVIWNDVPGEDMETYTVYASENPIVDLNDSTLEILGKDIPEGTQTVVHWLYYPLQSMPVQYYYAIICKDAAGNVSKTFTTAGPFTNDAKGIPTISLNPPANFAADGDFTEWENSGIVPFVLKPKTDHVPVGTVTDSSDLKGTVYLAVDQNNLYVAADVIDDVFHYGEGNWWDQDALQLFIGFYDHRGAPHSGIMRGDEPDYILYFVQDKMVRDNPENKALYTPDSVNYHFEELGGADYVIEAKIPFADLFVNADKPFVPQRGMRIPLDIYFHDNDGNGWEGNLGWSKNSTDHQWQNPGEWAFTWLGDTTHTITDVNDRITTVPVAYELGQNYPNPFNPTTTIEYAIAKPGLVEISLYNILGQKIRTLVNEQLPAGRYRVLVDGADLTSGVYFYTIKAGDFVQTRKLLLLK